jgi:hypothetical protein
LVSAETLKSSARSNPMMKRVRALELAAAVGNAWAELAGCWKAACCADAAAEASAVKIAARSGIQQVLGTRRMAMPWTPD